MHKLGVVCGFKAEVDCFLNAARRAGIDRSKFDIRPSGASSKQARELADALINDGATFLLSFGIAGGLDPRLAVGDIIFANHVVTTLDEAFGKTAPQKPMSTEIRLGTTQRQASVCGIDEIAFTPEEKAKLFRSTNAAIADMESHAVARAAAASDLPFMVLRSVSDSARDILPYFVKDAVKPDGSPKIAPALLALMKNPFQLQAMMALKRNTDRALASLEEATVKALPQFIGR